MSSQVKLLPSQSIKLSTTRRLLGETLDTKLRWKPHIENAKAKAMISLGAIARLSELTWGGILLLLGSFTARLWSPG